jgi:hypothetical protein
MSSARIPEHRWGAIVATVAMATTAACLAEPVPGADEDGGGDDLPAPRCAGFDVAGTDDEHRYVVIDEPARWLDALVTCAARGGYLAIIDGDDERGLLAGVEPALWVGAEDIDRDDRWRYVDGTPAFLEWGDSSGPGGQCAALHADGMDYAEGCGSWRPFICECAP